MAIPPIPISMADGGSGTHTIEPETLKDLNSSLNHVINTLTIAGAQQERIRIHDDLLKQRVEGINDILDKKENIDIAEAMMKLSQKQYAYEAALRASSMVLNQPSLIDFIR